MAAPTKFYADQLPKPNTYLHYWFTNSGLDKNLNGLLHRTAEKNVGPQLKRFQANLQSIKNTIKDAGYAPKEENTLLQLLDVNSYNQELLTDILAPTAIDESLDANLNQFLPKDLNECTDKLYALKNSNKDFDTRLQEFSNTLTQLVNMFDPTHETTKKSFAAAMNGMWRRWKNKALTAGYITEQEMKATNQTRTAQVAIDYIMHSSTNGNKIFKDMYVQGQKFSTTTTELTVGVQKMLVLAKALQELAKGKTGSLGVSSINRKGKDITDQNEILSILIQSVLGLINNTKGQVAENAMLEAYLKGSFLVDEELQKVIEQLKKTNHIQMHSGGTNVCDVSVTIDESTSLHRAIEAAKSKVNLQYQKQTSKADNYIQVGPDGASATIGFSVKTGKHAANMTYDGESNINLLGGTSLLVLLTREMHLSDSQLIDVMQLLGGHGSGNGTEFTNAVLNDMWNQLKITLKELAFVDALTGSNYGKGQAHFMVVGGSIISMESIIKDYINGDNLNIVMNRQRYSAGSMSRAVYMKQNVWKELSSGSNVLSAKLGMDRSHEAFTNISALLAKTKIQISLNIANMQSFRDLGSAITEV